MGNAPPTSTRRHSRDRCSQVFPGLPRFSRSSASVYYTERKPKNKKRGRPGNEATASAWNVKFSFCQLAYNYYSTCAQNGFFRSKNLFESSSVVLVSSYLLSIGHIRRHRWARARLLQAVRLRRMTRRQPSNISLQRVLLATTTPLHITNSHVATIKYHMHYPIFMACTGGAVIFLTSYPYTAWTQVSCQAVSPTNGLGTRLHNSKPLHMQLCLCSRYSSRASIYCHLFFCCNCIISIVATKNFTYCLYVANSCFRITLSINTMGFIYARYIQ